MSLIQSPAREDRRCRNGSLRAAGLLLLWLSAVPASAQEPPAAPPAADDAAQTPAVPDEVAVAPTASDAAIEERLRRILETTDWFEDLRVRVEDGVVFLSGRTITQEHVAWAAKLAGNTEGVAAVVNRIELVERSMWDLSPAWAVLRDLARSTVQATPLILLALVMLILTWIVARLSVRAAAAIFHGRLPNDLLRYVAARAVAIPIFILGLYLVLKVAGLTRLAVTVLGGAGVTGLVIGIAFRDIAENFLASILISVQRPFNTGDLVEVAGYTGYVQRVTTRGTLLMTFEGNHVRIPNSTIYKETIVNLTANPFLRLDFTVGIGYDDSIAEAQTIALGVLREHPAVVDEPESMVLVESLGAATVNLRVYLWIDITRHSFLKVKSAAIRLVKRALMDAGISLPDESREVVFPQGVPVRMLSPEEAPVTPGAVGMDQRRPRQVPEDAADSHAAEGELASEADEIQEQARKARVPEAGANLLENGR
ncbi:MAG: mechanosensitive ion channel [Planctomycetes bacterium]|nr:mechanosensitive ion channel [Planctomycetota bacterium]